MEKGGGGKGGGVGGGGKTSLKSIPASLGGKDDNSAKSKRGRKVQFNTEGLSEGKFTFSSKSDGKFETTYGKGGLTKGGKGDKVANGAKVSVVKEALPLELRVEQELPKNAKCLMDCEAAHILEGIQEQMALLSADPTIKIPVSFDKGLLSLSEHGVTDGEICVFANICPETVEEAYAIVPSLKKLRKELIVLEKTDDCASVLTSIQSCIFCYRARYPFIWDLEDEKDIFFSSRKSFGQVDGSLFKIKCVDA
ncbi:hypothetical protein WN944_012714 [Citrus x changshan-huyou]